MVTLRNSLERWGLVSKLFHWLMAVAFFVQIALGWCAVSWPLSPFKINLFVWHKSLGILILLLVALRLLWRLINKTPTPPSNMPVWERLTAHISHTLLYMLMVLVPLSGWVISSASIIPFRVFGVLPLPAITTPNQATEELAKTAHFYLFVALAMIVLVHIAAALHHHFVKRDDVLKKMLL